jgi:cation diffusion facilitator CzcD-associated flavoprotein CzcO
MINNSHFKWATIAEDHSADRPFSVLIIGGGFSGTVLAYQLLRRDPKLDIAIRGQWREVGTRNRV